MTNLHFGATEHQDKDGQQLVFSHKALLGAASQSYGIQVAQLAGLPKSIIQAAKKLLTSLEAKDTANKNSANISISDFSDTVENNINQQQLEALSTLENTNLDEISARQALELLYKLKDQLK